MRGRQDLCQPIPAENGQAGKVASTIGFEVVSRAEKIEQQAGKDRFREAQEQSLRDEIEATPA